MNDDVLDVRLDDNGQQEGPPAGPYPGNEGCAGPTGQASSHHGSWTWPVLGVLLVVLLIAPAAYMLFGSSSARARRHFLRGVALQTAGRFDEAVANFQVAMRLDSRLAAAGVRLGLCKLHLGSVSPDAAYLQRLVEEASRGPVAALDDADQAFLQALEMAQAAPPAIQFPDAEQPGLNKVKANAYAGLGLTRVLRAAGAIGAGRGSEALQLSSEALGYANSARSHDPMNLLASLVGSLAELIQTWARVSDLGML
ncbi:MAG: hypothetical protein N2512_15165 [Armatimonadetes bacterium]|nr:hypothetical protein [Armatimonadota bacterium]